MNKINRWEGLKTPRLLIRPFMIEDSMNFFNYRQDHDWLKFQSFRIRTQGDAMEFTQTMSQREFGKKGEWTQFAIEESEGQRLIGDIALKPEWYDERIVEFGISLVREKSGRGFASEAIKAIFNWLFTEKIIHRIYAITDKENLNSVKLCKAAGMRKEAETKESFYNTNFMQWRDEFIFAILKKEWKAASSPDMQ